MIYAQFVPMSSPKVYSRIGNFWKLVRCTDTEKRRILVIYYFYVAEMRNEHNIGESAKTSVKVHHGPGGQSNWSLGWAEDEKPKPSISFLNQTKSTTTKAMLYLEATMRPLMRRKRRRETKKGEKKKKNSIASCPPTIPSPVAEATCTLGMKSLTTDEKTR